eukprot:jgi/Botrbrau1/14865/Bobra.0326s0011.1
MQASALLQWTVSVAWPSSSQCKIIHSRYALPQCIKKKKLGQAREAAVLATSGVLTIPQNIPADVDSGKADGLSPYLRDSCAVLEAPNPSAPDGRAKVYVLGISHVSKRDCELVEELIQKVRPDIVVLELCKDRTPLLVPKERRFTCWLPHNIDFVGLPDREGWPKQAQLLGLLKSGRGLGSTTRDIEDDCVTLLSTGLFRSVRPSTSLAAPDAEVEQFVLDKEGDVAPAIPLGKVSFILAPRELPPLTSFSVRVDSSLPSSAPIPDSEIMPLSDQALEASSSGSGVVDVCLQLQPRLQALATRHFPEVPDLEVAYRGVEDGKVEAVLKRRRGGDSRSYLSGLEGTAEGGLGEGIEPFRVYRGPLVVGKTMRVDNVADVVEMEDESLDSAAAAISDLSPSTAAVYRLRSIQEYPPEEAVPATEGEEAGPPAAPEEEKEEKKNFVERVTEGAQQWLTTTYGRYNKEAGEKTGVEYGEAWRTAFALATSSGSKQIQLGDLPESILAQRLVRGIAAALPFSLAAAIGSIAAALAVQSNHLVPEEWNAAVAGAAILAVSASVWPFVGPLFEISQFAGKTGAEIEEIVRRRGPVSDPSTKTEILGEDALLKWPSARNSVIQQRDAFMARTLWAAATGKGAAPAYVADEVAGKPVWRYAMPEDGPEESCVPGTGQGLYKPVQDVKNVVAVVGSAHLPGIQREWATAADLSRLQHILADDSS